MPAEKKLRPGSSKSSCKLSTLLNNQMLIGVAIVRPIETGGRSLVYPAEEERRLIVSARAFSSTATPAINMVNCHGFA